MPRLTPSMLPSARMSDSSVNMAVVMGTARNEYGSVNHRREYARTDGPLSAKLYEAAFCTDTTANEHSMTTTAGTPMPSVSRRAGSRRFTRGRMRIPLRLSAGS